MPANRTKHEPSSGKPSNRKTSVRGLPPRGLGGTYEGACTSCWRGTDTGLVAEGVGPAHVAFLVTLGMSADQAEAAYGEAMGSELEPGSVSVVLVRLCAGCAAGVGLDVGLILPGGSVPRVRLEY